MLLHSLAPVFAQSTLPPGLPLAYKSLQKINQVLLQAKSPSVSVLTLLQSWLVKDEPDSGVYFLGILATLLIELGVVFQFRPEDRYKGRFVANSIPVSIILGLIFAESFRQAVLMGWAMMNLALVTSAVFHHQRAHGPARVVQEPGWRIEKSSHSLGFQGLQ